MKKLIAIPGFAVSAVALGFSCFSPTSAIAQDNEVIYLEQGWTEDQRKQYYHTSQGTAMLPLAFFRNLEQADSEALFSDPDHLDSLGMIAAPADEKYNPEGLPIGLALRTVEEGIYKGNWVGFSCASCHNGEIRYQGKTVRIDGGSNNIFSMPHFGAALRDALTATLADEAKLNRLIDRGEGEIDMSREEIRAELETIRGYLDYFTDKVAVSPYDFGPGRMDALTQIYNTLTGVYIETPENMEVTLAPTKSPFLWNASQSAWVQWSGVLTEPLSRNLGESLGAMVRVNLDPEKGELFELTVDLRGQITLEKTLWELAPPQWPEDVLGEIDGALAVRGKKLADTLCAGCHSVYPHRWSNPREEGKVYVENALVPQSYIGTDPRQFEAPLISQLPEYLSGKLAGYLAEPLTGAKAAGSGAIQDALKQGVIRKYLPALNLSDAEMRELSNYADPNALGPQVASYKAAPLDGMWSSPPYLHNNSVASVYDLLTPAAERPQSWKQGRDYDPVKMGVDTSGASGDYVVDTTLVGLSNHGHSFEDSPEGNGVIGRALTDDERYAIIEYLKTLPTEKNQVTPWGGPMPEGGINAWQDGTFFNVHEESGYTASEDAGEQKPEATDEPMQKSEAEQIRRITDIVMNRMSRTYADAEVMKRDAHPKTHGLVKARLIVETGLPGELRQGIFAEEREYDAVIRYSASFQEVAPDLVQQPHGMAIKVFGVEGAKLLEGHEEATTQDFVMINSPVFFLDDLDTYAELFEAQLSGGDAKKAFAENHPEVVKTVGRMIAGGGDLNNVFAVQYWSQTPYKFGPHTVKFSARPLSGANNDRPDIMLPEFLRTAMEKTLTENEVRFEFLVQLQKDPELQPLEKPSIEWKTADSQAYRVATIVIPKQDISAGKDLEVAENLSFNPWHSIEAHEPLGAVNRARREVYLHGAKLRRDSNGVEMQKEPTEIPAF